MEDAKARNKLLFAGLYFFWVAFSVAWFLVPSFVAATQINVVPMPSQFYALLKSAGFPAFAQILGLLLVWFIIPLAAWKVISSIIAAKLPEWLKPLSIPSLAVDIFASAVTLFVPVMHILLFAGSSDYFAALPWWTWLFMGLSIAWNAYSVILLISTFIGRDETYQQYRAFRNAAEAGKKSLYASLKTWGIQKRLTISFTGLLFVVIVVLAAVLLQDFSRSLLGAVKDNAHALADRTSSAVKTMVGDKIAIDSYFIDAGKKNSLSAIGFTDLTFYSYDKKKDVFITTASTSPDLLKATRQNEKFEADKDGRILVEKDDFMEFQAPVTLGGVSIGYVAVRYSRDIIYGPYFRTRTKAIMISALFLYLAVFLTYMLGQGIVFPILFLRMSVNEIASRLAAMVKGTEKISAERLRYDDRVDTKDEIKKLSLEVGNMTSVIRGVVPYISASTLQHSEREIPATESRDLAFLFTDIRGFTTLCEGRSPEDIVKMLNHYLDLQTNAIIANGGDVDKFVGDEVMAMFQGPDKELNACRAGMAIRKAMAAEQERARKESESIIAIGIGINTGPVTFGSVGSRDRMDFTSIGDTVNLAARLEGATKEYGTKTLVTEAVYENIKDVFLCREIDLMTVKGKKQPVRIYEFIQEKSAAAASLLPLKEKFEAGLAAYRKQSWASAKKIFTELVKTHKDQTSSVFLERIELFQVKPPPKDWDGVFNLTVK